MASPEEIRIIIREVLAEELASLKRPVVKEERVAIANDGDLARFVARLLELSGDAAVRDAMVAGRYLFRLENATGGTIPGASWHDFIVKTRFDSGLVTERQIDGLAEGTRQISVARGVRFTPLARDRLRSRGIVVERSG